MVSNKLFFTTVSDDRFGRKGGEYSKTQDSVQDILKSNEHLNISELFFWKFQDLISTRFYKENSEILNNPDPSINGRCYKPFVILDSLRRISDGDFLIYNDISPEHWRNVSFESEIFNTEILKQLCSENSGILSTEPIWIVDSEIVPHTHENFTTEICMDMMGMKNYIHSLQHASGFMVFQKTKIVIEFVEEWLKWNLIPECASLSSLDMTRNFYIPGKIGHRHDQSISGLILNSMNHKIVKNVGGFNFIDYCRKNYNYEFSSTNLPPSDYIYINVELDGQWKIVKQPRNPGSETSVSNNPLRLT
jgi:hypothetical protein